MRNGWPAKKLSDVCEIVMGTSPPGDTYNATGEGVPLINGPVEFSAGSFGKTVRTKFTTAPNKLCKENDLILCVRGSTTGKMNIAGFDACIGRGVAAIRAKEYQPWINYFIRTKRDDIYSLGTGATFPNISTADLADLTIPVPPLPEQRRIVGILDEAFDGIATAKVNAEKNLQNARALFESHLQSRFRLDTQSGRTLRDIAGRFGRGRSTNRPRGDPKLYGGAYPFIQTGDVSNAEHFIRDYSQTYNEAGLAQSRLWPRGTVCIVIVGVNVGATAILDFEACIPDSVIGIVVNEQFTNAEYVDYMLRSYRKSLSALGKGTARDNLNVGMFEDRKFPFPSLDTQKRLVLELNEVSEASAGLQSIYKRKLTALDELKKSLLHQAFSGQL